MDLDAGRGAAPQEALMKSRRPCGPDYPGDWIEYRDLPWFQPAFPRAGTRHALEREKPLVLEYRLWIRRVDAPDPAACAAAWKTFNSAHHGAR
jgi:hypothetical protein